MRHRLLLASLLVLPAITPPARAEIVEGEAATSSTDLTASPEEVRTAVLQALETWRIQVDDPERGLIKTTWVERRKGRETYRGRVLAQYSQDGYRTRLTVQHLKEKRLDDLRPTLGGPAATWRRWDGDYEIARAVIRSVEQAFGVEEGGLVSLDAIGRRPEPRPTVVRERSERVVSPQTAVRINELKARRKGLVTEIKAMDARILEAVYDDRYEEIRNEVEALKARKQAMERQVAEIDREILALVLSE